MAEKPVFLCDMDGTVADFHFAMRDALRGMASPAEQDIDWDAIISHEHGAEPPEWARRRMNFVKRKPGFWSGLPPVWDGMVVLELARKLGFELHVLTKGPRSTPAAWTEKLLWADKHLADVPVTVTQDKGLVYGRVLFDDFPPYINRWLEWRPRGLVLMLDQPWNRAFEHPNVVRVPRPLSVPGGDRLIAPVREALIAARDR